MNDDDLIRNVESAIGVLENAYRDGATESDLYEATLFALCVDAARQAGGTVLLTKDGTNEARRFRFRRSPGNLWRGDFTFARVAFPGSDKDIEVHLGVYVTASQSKVAHECDVAILKREEAERSRRLQVHPRAGGLVAAVEAKHYAASPSLGVGRGFLGLSTELGQDKCSLVFPASGSPTVMALIAKRRSQAYDELIPGGNAAGRLHSHLVQAIRNRRNAN
jgi:hypothetical protein